jgi:hypothetical protein
MRLSNSSTSKTTESQGEQMNQVVTSPAKESMPADPDDIIEQEMNEELKKEPLDDPTFVNDNVLENRDYTFVNTANKQMISNVLDPDSITQVESIDAIPLQLEQTYLYDAPNDVITSKINKWHGDLLCIGSNKFASTMRVLYRRRPILPTIRR